MKTLIITISIVLLSTCAMAQRTVTVWGQNGQATIYQVYPDGQVVGLTPGEGGLITGNLNDGNLYDNRLPNNSFGNFPTSDAPAPQNYQRSMDKLYGNLPR